MVEALTKTSVKETVGVVANVGVLIGIILLVFELEQNRQMTRAQTRNALAETTANLQLTLATNPDLQDIFAKATAGETLSAVELQRYRNTWTAFFRFWENVHYQHQIGLYDDSEYFAQRQAWRRVLGNNAVLRDFWCSRQPEVPSDFFDEVTGLLESGCE